MNIDSIEVECPDCSERFDCPDIGDVTACPNCENEFVKFTHMVNHD